MRSLVLVFLFLAGAGVALADGDGTGILPFTSPNCSGCVEVHEDGTVVVRGVLKGVPFQGVGKATVGKDGRTVVDCDVYIDAKVRRQPGTDVPVHVEIEVDPEDYSDGNPVDDPVGTVDVHGGPLGSGSIQVYG